jgi:prevent-host-death family protein
VATQEWQLQDAKARFSELVKSAQRDGPQRITVHGRPAAVVLSDYDYARLIAKKPTFVELIEKSPLKGTTLPIERDKSRTRDVPM